VFISELLEEFGPTVAVLLDDVLIEAPTLAELVYLETRILAKFSRIELKFNPEKSAFHQREVTYLGHRIHQDGLRAYAQRTSGCVEKRQATYQHHVPRVVFGENGFYERFL